MRVRFLFSIVFWGMALLAGFVGCKKSTCNPLETQQTVNAILKNSGWEIIETKLVSEPINNGRPGLKIGFEKYSEIVVAVRSGVEVAVQTTVKDGMVVGMICSSKDGNTAIVADLKKALGRRLDIDIR